jgi:hypothetical protein
MNIEDDFGMGGVKGKEEEKLRTQPLPRPDNQLMAVGVPEDTQI